MAAARLGRFGPDQIFVTLGKKVLVFIALPLVIFSWLGDIRGATSDFKGRACVNLAVPIYRSF